MIEGFVLFFSGPPSPSLFNTDAILRIYGSSKAVALQCRVSLRTIVSMSRRENDSEWKFPSSLFCLSTSACFTLLLVDLPSASVPPPSRLFPARPKPDSELKLDDPSPALASLSSLLYPLQPSNDQPQCLPTPPLSPARCAALSRSPPPPTPPHQFPPTALPRRLQARRRASGRDGRAVWTGLLRRTRQERGQEEGDSSVRHRFSSSPLMMRLISTLDSGTDIFGFGIPNSKLMADSFAVQTGLDISFRTCLKVRRLFLPTPPFS